MTLQFYDEFELYLNSIRDAEFTSLIQQVEKPVWSIYHMDLDDIHIQYGRENSGHIASGTIRVDGWVFFLMLTGNPVRANGLKLDETSAFIIPPGRNFHISTKRTHEWMSIFIPSDLLSQKYINKYHNNHITNLDPNKLNHFIERIKHHYLSSNSSAITYKVNAKILINLIANLANNLISESINKQHTKGRKTLNRNDIITESLCAINNTNLIDLNIKSLLDATKVSERTLRSAFYEFFDISPIKYISLVRLHEAKNMILDSKNSNKTIAFIATSVGFFDQGRFAKRYQSLFGELPHETQTRIKKK